MSEPLLSVQDLSKHFGGLAAVREVSFAVQPGQIKAIIGPNGAGKTTIFNLLCGFLPANEGRAQFAGQDILGLPPHRIAGMGMSRTFQNVRLFKQMSVLENVSVGLHRQTRTGFLAGALDLPRVRREERVVQEQSQRILAFVGLKAEAHRLAGHLPFGQQRILELARAPAAEPHLLLLDEPAAGLNEQETTQLATVIQRIRERDVTVLLVEHDMRLVMDIADEIMVLNYGAKIAEGPPQAIQTDSAVVSAYLGQPKETTIRSWRSRHE